jgi:hypothetical protein
LAAAKPALATDGLGHIPEVDPVSRLSATTRNPLSENVVSLSFAPNLAYLAALFGVLQNDTAPMIIDNAPFFDLL